MQPAAIEHLYFHIPFCPKACPYCCFYFEEGSKNKNDAFLNALITEVDHAHATHTLRPKTLYFGGGTPTSLRVEQLQFLLSEIAKRIDLSHLEEWTFEANPATLRTEKAQLLRQCGVTRVSLGVQSWNPKTLSTLGRIHTPQQADESLVILRESRFPSVNIDLMFAIPNQTPEEWEKDLKETALRSPDHVSAYCLTYEEDTEFFKKLGAGELHRDELTEERFFRSVMEFLPANGLHQYEISNYAKQGHESRHNFACWSGKDYIGFGPSAFSTVGLKRTQNVANTEAYIQSLSESGQSSASIENLNQATRDSEILAFGIRRREGVPSRRLGHKTAEVAQLTEAGLLEVFQDNLRLTLKGKLLADTVAQYLL